MSKTPAKEFHSLLRTKFAPYVPEWGGREMTLNSIYSLVFAVKSDKKDDDGSCSGTSSIAKAISNLCTSSSSNSHDDGVYTIMIKNEPTLRLLSCNTLKHITIVKIQTPNLIFKSTHCYHRLNLVNNSKDHKRHLIFIYKKRLL